MSSIKKSILQIPLVQVFSKEKLVRSSLLNKWGIQPLRMKIATRRYKNRKWSVDPIVAKEAREVAEKGITQIDDFLSPEHFAQVAEECRALRDEGNWHVVTQMGPNVIKNINLKEIDLTKYPALKKLMEEPRIEALFEAAEKRPLNIYDSKNFYFLLQYLVQGDEDTFDPESALHTDTFFNTHKAWLYIDDVKLENGPFVYVENSHLADSEYRRKKEYEYSQIKGVKGSRRIPQKEVEEQGLEEKICTCDKNTLVMANTLGYHRRLNGVGGHDRLTFAISARFNPFF